MFLLYNCGWKIATYNVIIKLVDRCEGVTAIDGYFRRTESVETATGAS